MWFPNLDKISRFSITNSEKGSLEGSETQPNLILINSFTKALL